LKTQKNKNILITAIYSAKSIMKIAVTGRAGKDVEMLAKQIKACRHQVVKRNPEVVITLGGDGSFLWAERKYPSVPKLMIRNHSICKKCTEGEVRFLLDRLLSKKYKIKSSPKIEAVIKKKNQTIKKLAANDIVIRNKEQWHALRFTVAVNNKPLRKEYIGDGVVVATPFGSTGYFKSVAGRRFHSGIGLAFNNPTEKAKPIIMKDPVLKVAIKRNTALLSADNDPKTVSLKPGDSAEIKKSKEEFKIVQIP
jgi:NAD+ kinase